MALRPLLLVALVCALSSCSVAELQDAVDTGKDLAAERAAVVAAETLRVRLLSEATSRGVDPGDAALVAELSAAAWAGTVGPVVNGAVEVAALGGVACLRLPTAADDGEARPGPCEPGASGAP